MALFETACYGLEQLECAEGSRRRVLCMKEGAQIHFTSLKPFIFFFFTFALLYLFGINDANDANV